VKGKPDNIGIVEKKRLTWYGHVKRMPEERLANHYAMDTTEEAKKSRRRKTCIEGVQAVLTARNLETGKNGVWFVGDGDSCYRTG
jgi:hypothetical protein